MIIDTHCHYDDEAFDTDREAVLTGLTDKNVCMVINSGASLRGTRDSVSLAEKYSHVYATVGIHPDNAGDLTEEVFSELRTLACSSKVLGIGEIGLDYHWDVWPRETQKAAFIRQWDLADELSLPVVIHSRDAAEDTFSIISERYTSALKIGKELRAELHCYSYSPEQAKEYLKMGLYFGVGGVVTFKNARKLIETVSLLPLERILLETDCPYLAPEPFRGQRNNSAYISYVAEKIAMIKSVSVDEVLEVTEQNARRFFNV